MNMAEIIKVPEDWEVVAIRPPKKGEMFWHSKAKFIEKAQFDFAESYPVLRKKVHNATGFEQAINDAHATSKPLPAGPHTFEAAVREGEKFTEDALAVTCESLRIELGLKKDTINELTARVAELEQRLNDRRILLTAEMAAELIGKVKNLNADGTWPKETLIYFTVADAEKQALEIYEFFEKRFGEKK